MNRHGLDAALTRIGRLAAPALVVAALATGSAFAQSSTTIITEQPPVESSRTKIETRTNDLGETVEKRTTVTDHGDGTVSKEVTKTREPDAPSTTTVIEAR